MKKIVLFLLLSLTFSLGSIAEIVSPGDSVSVSDAVITAARINGAYNGVEVTDHMTYAVNNGIIKFGEYTDMTAPITRGEFARILYNSISDCGIATVNNYTKIPDVPKTNKGFEAILSLYNSGILTGTDRFGNFLPDKELTYSQISAIVSRIPMENRVTIQAVDGNYEDGYYLIDQTSTGGFDDTSSYKQNAWSYDDTNRFGVISNTTSHINDTNTNGYVDLFRDIEAVDSGLLGWDFYGYVKNPGEGLSFRLADDNNNNIARLWIHEGKYYFGDYNTNVSAVKGNLYFSMRLDLDADTADIYLAGRKVGTGLSIVDGTISKVSLYSTVEGTGAVEIYKTDVYKNYVVRDLFLDPVNAVLNKWTTTGSAVVKTKGGEPYQKDINSAYLTAGATASQSFKDLSGNIVFETYMLLNTTSSAGYIEVRSGENSVAKVSLSSAGVFANNDVRLRHHTNGIWQCIRMEIDTINGKVLYKVNGKACKTLDFASVCDSIDNIVIGSTAGNLYFDDVSLYFTHNYDDYCPQPVTVGNDGYNTIMNICSLWHEGGHYGWSAVNAFPDIEPALGYYDEGLPEVADWEIKFMLENGIDVQHYCWYAGPYVYGQPIKSPRNFEALHDGFFNAKYSDEMKFMIMWENTGKSANSLSAFESYIWNYWVDYYFLDDRYFKLDNKPVITIWNYSNLKTHLGVEVDEVISFMNEKILQYGFDGIIVLFADNFQNSTTIGNLSNAVTNPDGIYAYHWSQDGNNFLRTKTHLEAVKSNDIHSVPTVSVGFNDVGWSGVRKPLISLEDHKSVLRYIVDDYLPAQTGDGVSWHNNTLIVSTWNEYGEGTYVMPCEGLYGFGYLENVAEVVSGVTDHSNNIYPTETQKARLGHMYPKNKTSIRRLGLETASEDETDEKILYSVTGADFERSHGIYIHKYSIKDGVFIAETFDKDSGIKIASADKKPNIEASSVKFIKLTLKSNISCMSEIFFNRTGETAFHGSRKITHQIEASDTFKDYYVSVENVPNWNGTITDLRLDILTEIGKFEFKSLELITIEEFKMSTHPKKVLYRVTGGDCERSHGIAYGDFSISNGVFIGKTNATDSGIIISSNDKKPSVPAADIVAIKIRLKSSVDCTSELFFNREGDASFHGTRKINYQINKSDVFEDYYIYVDNVKEWSGVITDFRIDVLTVPGIFEFESLELLTYEDYQIPYHLYVDGVEYVPEIVSINNNDECYMPADAYAGFFSLNNFYYEWSRFTGRLYMRSHNGTELVFNVGSKICLVNGEERVLAHSFRLIDGLPLIPLKFVYDNAGIEYEIEGKTINAYSMGKAYYLANS